MTHHIGELSREWFDVVWNGRDEAAIARLGSPQAICHGLSEERDTVAGFELFKLFRRNFLSAFPDIHVRVDDVLVDGDKSVVRLVMTGTHKGDGIGVPPSGRKFKASGIVIMRWKDGQIIEGWNEFDAAGMMRQLQSPEAKLLA